MATYAHPRSIENARQMRKSMTPPEARLWIALRRRQVDGLKFRRQHPIGPFVLDFFCASRMLAVEVDGNEHAHEDQLDHDRDRDLWLERRGVTVLRIPAWTVRDDLDLAIATISALTQRLAGRGRRPPSALRATSP